MSGTRRKPGRMGPYVEGFAARLRDLGYTPGTIGNELKLVGQLGRWLEREDLGVTELSEGSAEVFVESLRVRRRRRPVSVRSLRPLFDYLRAEGVLTGQALKSSPVGTMLADYRDWLTHGRGLAPATVLRYENLARRFLEERHAVAGSQFVADLAGGDVVAFLMREVARVSVGSAKGRVAEIRSLLRFLHTRGFTAMALAPAVPPVAGWRETALPRGSPPVTSSGCSGDVIEASQAGPGTSES